MTLCIIQTSIKNKCKLPFQFGQEKQREAIYTLLQGTTYDQSFTACIPHLMANYPPTLTPLKKKKKKKTGVGGGGWEKWCNMQENTEVRGGKVSIAQQWLAIYTRLDPLHKIPLLSSKNRATVLGKHLTAITVADVKVKVLWNTQHWPGSASNQERPPWNKITVSITLLHRQSFPSMMTMTGFGTDGNRFQWT